MKTVIKNGIIVTAVDEYRADLLIENEKISAIGTSLEKQADNVVDAEGLYVLPGGVDQHTHFNFTFKTATVRGFETSNAALAGGTTTIVDFANQEMGKSLKESIEKYRKMVLIRLRGQPVLQCRVGTEKMSDNEIAENIHALMGKIEEKLKRGIQNVRSIYVKSTMGSPFKVKM